MAELVPLRIKIGLNEQGQHKFPNFDQISPSIRKGMDWSKYVDKYGLGWHYDKVDGHGEGIYGSEEWGGYLVVPEDFANAAVALFPNEVEIRNETDFENFYNDRAHVREPELQYDLETLQGIELKSRILREFVEDGDDHPLVSAEAKAKKAAGQKVKLSDILSENDKKALDPDSPEPGIRKNKRKKWQDFKALKKITIKQLP